ncbi:MAG TPA: phosphatase PAP2 family protein [Mycobacteriales bacterium]|nr:phosphatase PAP2 family protein [Mycobacteriales bacterium]
MRARTAVRALVVSGALLAVLTALVTTRWGPLLGVDLAVGRWFHGIAVDRPSLVRAGDVVAVASRPDTFRAVVVVLAAWLLWRREARLAFWAVLAMTAGGLAGIAGKALTGRARPSFPDPVAHAGGLSYPSGHAVNAALGVLVILLVAVPLLRRRAARAGALATGALAVLITGLDRLVLGVHYLTDVVAGCLAAVVVVAVTALVIRVPPPR